MGSHALDVNNLPLCSRLKHLDPIRTSILSTFLILTACNDSNFGGNAPQVSPQAGGNGTTVQLGQNASTNTPEISPVTVKSKANPSLSPDKIEQTTWEGCCPGWGRITETGYVDFPYSRMILKFEATGKNSYKLVKMLESAFSDNRCQISFKQDFVDKSALPYDVSSNLADMNFSANGRSAAGKHDLYLKNKKSFTKIQVTYTILDNNQLMEKFDIPSSIKTNQNCTYNEKTTSKS